MDHGVPDWQRESHERFHDKVTVKSLSVSKDARIAELEEKLSALTEWRTQESEPETGVFLSLLEREQNGSRVHVTVKHKNLTVIGNHFTFDMPKRVGWLPLPTTSEPVKGMAP